MIVQAPPLATIDDLERVLGRTLSEDERPRAEFLLAAVSNRLRRLTGQELSAGESHEFHDGRWSQLLQLDQVPIIDVRSVQIEDRMVTDVRINHRTGSLWRRGCWWAERQGIVVSYRHGYKEIPEDLVLVLSSMVDRALSSPDQGGPAGGGNLESERFGPYTYRFANPGLGAVGLTAAEQETVNAYRVRPEVIP
jgi:hypothetical protein